MRWAKALLAAFALAATAELLAARPSGVPLDYYVWAISLLGGAAASLDLAECWRRHGLYSTCIASLASLALIAAGRLGSLALNWAYYDFLTPLVGSPYAPGAAALAAIAVAGSISASATALVHAALGRPASAGGPTLADLWAGASSRLRGLLRPPYLYASAFLLGFAFRLVPELIWWPYPLGWDTVDYIAHLEDFLARPDPFAAFYWEGGMAHLPPLLDLVAAPLALAVGAWYAFKVLPPIIYGLSSAAAAYLARSIGARPGAALLAAAAFAFYLFDLAISWEFQREALGTLLLLAALGLMESKYDERPWASASLLILSALAHQETAYMAFAVGLVAGARGALRGNARGALAGLAAAAASAALEVWYWGGVSTPNPYVGAAPLGLSAYSNYLPTAQGVLMYVAAGLGPGLALALIALAERRPLYISAALAAILLAGVSPAIAPYTSVVFWNLFLMQAGPLIAPLAGVALAEVKNKAAAALAFLSYSSYSLRSYMWPSPAT
nr:MAG: hypothetical protein TU35_06900 [Thermoproteus sp. AZ2]